MPDSSPALIVVAPPVPEAVASTSGWRVREFPAVIVVMSGLWFPASDNTPAEETWTLEDVIVKELAEPTDQVEEAAPVRLSAPADVSASVPEVVVCKVRFAPVTLKEEAAPDLIETAPAEALPIETDPVELTELMLVAKFEESFKETAAPETVRPAWPVTSPEKVGFDTTAMVTCGPAAPVVVMFEPWTSVTVLPWLTVAEPEEPAMVKSVPVRAVELICPEPLMI